MMEDFLNKNIKDIINEYPQATEILDSYGIGCTLCSAGSCRLGDIIDIHNLTQKDAVSLIKKLAECVYPGEEIELPKDFGKKQEGKKETKFSPPFVKLVDEHKIIKRFLALVPGVLDDMDLSTEDGRGIILKSVNFIRFFADKYHHAKEEDILFKYFDKDLDILKVMREDHEKARGYVRAVIEAVDKQDDDTVKEYLASYVELLKEHIKKEDEVLYPWMERNMEMSQIGRMFSSFGEADENNSDIYEKYTVFVEEMEKQYGKK